MSQGLKSRNTTTIKNCSSGNSQIQAEVVATKLDTSCFVFSVNTRTADTFEGFRSQVRRELSHSPPYGNLQCFTSASVSWTLIEMRPTCGCEQPGKIINIHCSEGLAWLCFHNKGFDTAVWATNGPTLGGFWAKLSYW